MSLVSKSNQFDVVVVQGYLHLHLHNMYKTL
jgi:hypothetical protein